MRIEILASGYIPVFPTGCKCCSETLHSVLWATCP